MMIAIDIVSIARRISSLRHIYFANTPMAVCITHNIHHTFIANYIALSTHITNYMSVTHALFTSSHPTPLCIERCLFLQTK